MTRTQLRVARAAAGLTQEELADLVLANRVTISLYETGEGDLPDTDITRLLVKVLTDYPHINMTRSGELQIAMM